MKKLISTLLILSMMTGLLAGCSRTDVSSADNADTETLSIVTTIFPEYDWVRQILGNQAEHVDLSILLDNGVDLHSYQPSTDDIIRISTCDMFIYIGGESDGWVDDTLKEAVNKDMVVINLLDVLGDAAKQEEVIEGMQEHEHEEEEHEHEHEEGELEYDEHIWLSLKNAKTLCTYLAKQLETLDGANAAAYQDNADAYIQQLDELDIQYQLAAAKAPFDTLLFGDRFPFRYLMDDYNLNYYAAFLGCSAESEASFETIVFLANKVNELGLSHVLTIENSDQKIAGTVVENTASQNQSILTMDSIQSVTTQDIADGITYLSIMQNNLSVLTAALN